MISVRYVTILELEFRIIETPVVLGWREWRLTLFALFIVAAPI